jgi:1-acyl-sn-glycerol-3-phosphate acyltransferase
MTGTAALRRPTPAATVVLALRSALYLVLLVLTVAPYSFLTLAWSWVPQPRRYWLVTGWTRFAIFAARVVCGIRCEIRGRENLPDGPAIVLCKHQSAWETLWLTTAMPRPLTFVYKRELNFLPFFGWGIATLGMINIDRSRGKDAFEQVVEQGTERLARGWWIVIFPEGTRTAPGATPRYKTGGSRLAVRTHAPVIPIAVNSGELWPRRAFLKMPGTITVSIGPPNDPAGKTAEAVAERVENWIETEMHAIAPHRYPAPNGARSPLTSRGAASA